jgi:hypothetical protein
MAIAIVRFDPVQAEIWRISLGPANYASSPAMRA